MSSRALPERQRRAAKPRGAATVMSPGCSGPGMGHGRRSQRLASTRQQPSFVDVPAYSAVDARGSTTMIANLEPGRYGMVCLSVADTPYAFPASGLFTIGE